jgi:chromosome segregation ATPase
MVNWNDYNQATEDRDRYKAELDDALAEIDRLRSPGKGLYISNEERNSLWADCMDERDTLRAENKRLRKENEQLCEEIHLTAMALIPTLDEMRLHKLAEKRIEELRRQRNQLQEALKHDT